MKVRKVKAKNISPEILLFRAMGVGGFAVLLITIVSVLVEMSREEVVSTAILKEPYLEYTYGSEQLTVKADDYFEKFTDSYVLANDWKDNISEMNNYYEEFSSEISELNKNIQIPVLHRWNIFSVQPIKLLEGELSEDDKKQVLLYLEKHWIKAYDSLVYFREHRNEKWFMASCYLLSALSSAFNYFEDDDVKRITGYDNIEILFQELILTFYASADFDTRDFMVLQGTVQRFSKSGDWDFQDKYGERFINNYDFNAEVLIEAFRMCTEILLAMNNENAQYYSLMVASWQDAPSEDTPELTNEGELYYEN